MSKEMTQKSSELSSSRGSVATIQDLSFRSPDRVLFYDLNLSIRKGENVVVMGESGSGKSTLLRIISGREDPTTGSISIPSDVSIGYVPQDIEDLDVSPEATIQEIFYDAKGLNAINKRKSELEHQMSLPENAESLDSIFEEYQHVVNQFEDKNGYEADADIEKILTGLRLSKNHEGNISLSTKVTEVSSGQKTKILLGQALFADTDFLVLDDPTSHLDVASVNWLSEYLKSSDKSSLVSTNNIDFINSCADRVLEITNFGRVLTFQGNYDQYSEKREALLDSERAAAAAVKAEKDRIESTYKEFKSRQIFKRSADMAQVGRAMQSRIKRLKDDLAELPGSAAVDRNDRVKDLIFTEGHRSGEDVVTIKKLVKRYGDFDALNLAGIDLTIRRGEIFLISGENGSGKSTLLRMINSSINDEGFQPDEGEIDVGAGIQSAYFAPDHIDIANNGSVLQEVASSTRAMSEGEASAALMFWGFPRQSLRIKNIEQLSAGEKKQLALAKIMVQHPNLLILDEPTDYLKPELIERLVNAINGYTGTTLLVSHNPEFIDLLSIDRELSLPRGRVILRG